MAKSKKKSKKLSVDFSDTSVRDSFAEGDYVGTLESIEHDADAGDDGGIKFNYTITEGKKEGKTLTNFCSLATNALFRLRQTLEDHGIETPDSTMDLDLKEIAEEIGEDEWDLTVTHTMKGDKVYTNVSVFERDGDSGGEDKPDEDEVNAMDVDELEECIDDHSLDVDLDGAKGKGKNKLAAQRQMVIDALDSDEEEDSEDSGEDKPDDDEVNAMDLEELEEVVDDHDLEVELDEAKGKGKKKLANQRAMVIEALDSEGEEDETYSKDDINAMKAKELEQVVEDAELGIELEGKVKAKRKAVIAALEEAELLDD